MNNQLASLNLPAAIRVQATRLLGTIAQARDPSDLLRAADRAEGFVLGVETVRALAPLDVDNLYGVFAYATLERQAGFNP